MKLSKSLLKAIAIGVTVSAATSCVATLTDTETEPIKTDEKVVPTDESCIQEGTHNWEDCPACGMG